MTAIELRQFINDIGNTKGVEAKLPDHLDVDPITYANVCQFIFDNHQEAVITSKFIKHIEVAVGINNGILFKGIELIVKETK